MDGLTSATLVHAERTSIHPSAVVAPGAELGRGVRIGPFCMVGANAVLEDGVQLVSHAVVDGHTVIGADSKLYPFTSVGLEPQDLKYRGEPTRCVVGARTHIRENVTIHRGTATGRGITRVGDDCMLMAASHVAHDCDVGDRVIVANNAVMGGHVTIGDGAVIGGQSAIHQHARIGRGAMISGVTGVAADVVPFGLVFGNRGVLSGMNVVGLRRRGYDRTQIHRMRTVFRLLFAGSGVFADRLGMARADHGHDPLIAELLDFITAPSDRGLIQASLAGAAEAESV